MNIEDFKAFLVSEGCTLLLCKEGVATKWHNRNLVGIVYDDLTTNSVYASEMVARFESSPSNPNNHPVLIDQLTTRDGGSCFYCDKVLVDDDIVIEELVPANFTKGDGNLVLSCQPCNKAHSKLSVVDKIKVRDTSNN